MYYTFFSRKYKKLKNKVFISFYYFTILLKMPIPTEQVMQLIADNLAMINKLTNQLKTEQDARAHA